MTVAKQDVIFCQNGFKVFLFIMLIITCDQASFFRKGEGILSFVVKAPFLARL